MVNCFSFTSSTLPPFHPSISQSHSPHYQAIYWISINNPSSRTSSCLPVSSFLTTTTFFPSSSSSLVSYLFPQVLPKNKQCWYPFSKPIVNLLYYLSKHMHTMIPNKTKTHYRRLSRCWTWKWWSSKMWMWGKYSSKKTINQSFLSSISLSLKKKTLNGFYLLHSLNSLIPLDPDRLLKPCSSGNLADCSCNKATGCACSSSVTTHQTLVILQSTHRDIYDLLLLLCLPIYSCSDIFDIIGSDHDDSKGKSYNSIRQSSLSLSTWYLRLCQLSLQGFFKVGERRDWRS